jgi:hypothetical protein
LIENLLPQLHCIWPEDAAERRKPMYLAVRPAGNLLFGHGGPVTASYDAISKLGNLSALFVGDRHHIKSYPQIAADFSIPLCCSKEEANVAKRKGVAVDTILEYKQHYLHDDLEVIPTPGHTTGALSYLLALGKNRILFVGDTIVSVDNKWDIYVTKKRAQLMLATMDVLADADFNYIAVDSFVCTQWLIPLDKRAKDEMIESVVTKVHQLS